MASTQGNTLHICLTGSTVTATATASHTRLGFLCRLPSLTGHDRGILHACISMTTMGCKRGQGHSSCACSHIKLGGDQLYFAQQRMLMASVHVHCIPVLSFTSLCHPSVLYDVKVGPTGSGAPELNIPSSSHQASFHRRCIFFPPACLFFTYSQFYLL